jgi:hypothetical protein
MSRNSAQSKTRSAGRPAAGWNGSGAAASRRREVVVEEPILHTPQRGSGRHEMRVAFPSRSVARRLGLNRNHHLRVWCICMDLGNVGLWGDENDPRRLGNYDALGIVDTREPESALNLYRKHLESQ